MLFSVKLKADTEEGTPNYADYQGGVICWSLGAVMCEWNECWGGRGVCTVCVEGRLFSVFGEQSAWDVSKQPQQKLACSGWWKGDRPGACLQKCSQHVHLCWAIARLPGFAGLCVFPLVSLGETVSLRDKIRQSYEGGRHLNHQNRWAAVL